MAVFKGTTQIAGMGDENVIPAGLSYLTTTGDGNKYLANDGCYYTINNFGIDDTNPTSRTAYSSEMIEEKLDDLVNNLILPAQNDAPTMWQKTYLNVSAGDTLEMITSEAYTMDKVIVQAYKFVEGATGIVEVLKTFNNAEQNNFYYNPEMVDFVNYGDGKMKIKDNYTVDNILNANGYYESALISKSNFVDFNTITVEDRI